MHSHDSMFRFTADTTRFYHLLEVEKWAADSDIKRAYRRLAVQHHPDKGGDQERFKEITEAYEVLRDPALRAKYDEFGEAGLRPNFVAEEAFFVATPSKEEAPDRGNGGLVGGTCLMATVAASLCGLSAAAGVCLCGAGRALQGMGGSSGRRFAAVALMCCGGLMLWPLFGPTEGLSVAAWTVAVYAVTVAGLYLLLAQWERMPAFLPYLLFAGYLLLFLLVPTRSAERVLMELPGFVLIEDGQVESDCALAEASAIFTWGMVAVHRIMSRAAAHDKRDGGGQAGMGSV